MNTNCFVPSTISILSVNCPEFPDFQRSMSSQWDRSSRRRIVKSIDAGRLNVRSDDSNHHQDQHPTKSQPLHPVGAMAHSSYGADNPCDSPPVDS